MIQTATYTRVNNPNAPFILGEIQLTLDRKIKITLCQKHKGMLLSIVAKNEGPLVSSMRFNPSKKTIKVTVKDRYLDTDFIYTFDETKDGIYMTHREKKTGNDFTIVSHGGLIIDKFQWLVMRRRVQKFNKVTIEMIMDSMKGNYTNPYKIKGTTITPMSSVGGKKKVKVVNEMNPDGFILLEDGNIEEESILDIVATWSERDQDLFMLRNFTSQG